MKNRDRDIDKKQKTVMLKNNSPINIIADKIKLAVSEPVLPYFSKPFYPEHSSAESVTPETKIIKSDTNRSF